MDGPYACTQTLKYGLPIFFPGCAKIHDILDLLQVFFVIHSYFYYQIKKKLQKIIIKYNESLLI
jgi:hypothetical protein